MMGWGRVDLTCAWPACPLGRVTVSRLSLCHLQCTHLRTGLGFTEIEVSFQSQGRMLVAPFMPWSQYRPHLSNGHCLLRTPISSTPHPFDSPFYLQGSQRLRQIWLILPFSLNLSVFFLCIHTHTHTHTHTQIHTHTHTHTEFKPPLKITSPSEEVLILSVHLLLPLSLVPVAAFSEILPVFITKWLQRCWGVWRQVLLCGFHQVRFYLKRLFTKDSHPKGQRRAGVV